MTDQPLRETDLYAPLKALLVAQGYEVKGEIGDADLVACRIGQDGEPEDPVIVELKTGFSLTLLQQAVARQSITDAVYVAVPHRPGAPARKALMANLALARRLGLGVMTVRLSDGHVTVHADPSPYRPRVAHRRRSRLLREFARRTGDPTQGGATRSALVTAYRQDALRCAAHLAAQGPCKGAHVAAATGVGRATRLMADNHYGWFARVATGVYTLTPAGEAGLAAYAQPE